MLRIDRSLVSDSEASHLANRNEHAYQRRRQNALARRCLNETLSGTHGPATHGCLCLACRETHRGHRLESMLGAEGYWRVRRAAATAGVTVRQYVREQEPELMRAFE
jgi:hypothetical protein